jgi:hypothetical protein
MYCTKCFSLLCPRNRKVFFFNFHCLTQDLYFKSNSKVEWNKNIYFFRRIQKREGIGEVIKLNTWRLQARSQGTYRLNSAREK